MNSLYSASIRESWLIINVIKSHKYIYFKNTELYDRNIRVIFITLPPQCIHQKREFLEENNFKCYLSFDTLPP